MGSRPRSDALPSLRRRTSLKVLRVTPLGEWLNFLNIASGSATEAYYLAHVARRLTLVEEQEAIGLEQGYSELGASLRAMSRVLREKSASTQRPEAKG